MLSIPKAPRVPHDFEALLSFQAPQRIRHIRRCAESAARAAQVDLEGCTEADQLG